MDRNDLIALLKTDSSHPLTLTVLSRDLPQDIAIASPQNLKLVRKGVFHDGIMNNGRLIYYLRYLILVSQHYDVNQVALNSGLLKEENDYIGGMYLGLWISFACVVLLLFI